MERYSQDNDAQSEMVIATSVQESREEVEVLKQEEEDQLPSFERWLFKNIDLLISRTNKIVTLKTGSIDYWTYYDAILVQVRVMFIESPMLSKNYSAQNYLQRIGASDLEIDIECYFDNEISDGITLREGIRTSVDKFIAHYDNICDYDLMVEHTCRIKLAELEKILPDLVKDMLLRLFKGDVTAWGKVYLVDEAT